MHRAVVHAFPAGKARGKRDPPCVRSSTMRRWLIPAMLLATVGFQTGCGSGMAYDSRERQHHARKILENDLKQLVDDWDLLWLNDQNLRTSRWSVE